jgi:hypothetical protein
MVLPITLNDLSSWNFDIDRFLNPYLPAPPWEQLPYPISRFFGYRKIPPKEPGNIAVTFWAFISIFCGISIVEAISQRISHWLDHGSSLVFSSYVSHVVCYDSCWTRTVEMPAGISC